MDPPVFALVDPWWTLAQGRRTSAEVDRRGRSRSAARRVGKWSHAGGSSCARLELRPRHVARQVLHPAVGGYLQALGRDVLQGRLDAASHLVGRLRWRVVREVEHTEDDRLAR